MSSSNTLFEYWCCDAWGIIESASIELSSIVFASLSSSPDDFASFSVGSKQLWNRSFARSTTNTYTTESFVI